MPTLSVVVITKNAESQITDCLKSVSWADQIIVLDADSADATASCARRCGAEVTVSDDWPGFGRQRQRAQALATQDWILMLDADEQVTPELAGAIRGAVAENNQNRVYEVCRRSWCFGRFIYHGGWYPDPVVRLYPRLRTQYNDSLVHEKVLVSTDLTKQRLSGDILHFTYPTLRHYLEKSAHYAEAWAAQRAQQQRHASLAQGCAHGLACFIRMYLLRGGFLDGRAGFLLAVLSAHSTFVKYADLWLYDQPPPPHGD